MMSSSLPKLEYSPYRCPPGEVQSVNSDDYVQVHADHQFESTDDEYLSEEEGPAVNERAGKQKHALFRPQVTVNVFNGSGSDKTESKVEDQAASSNIKSSCNCNDLISDLVGKLDTMSKKVEQLSSLVAAKGPQIETGTWDTRDVRPWQEPRGMTEARINFSKEFKSIPAVNVSIQSAWIYCGDDFRLGAYATAVDSKGFTIHAYGWVATEVYSCAVSWMAIGE
ncbi:hypothetical protein GGS26DRAFT_234072 [Hypomontagnella submonticulosa]|nr:hypothetical protein GGS26DRAFT_234072 [Hypomontagnella submonticulosa]